MVACLLVLAACEPQPQALPVASLESLGLDRPMEPLTDAVIIGLGAWVPVTRYCDAESYLLNVGGRLTPSSGKTCAAITTAPLAGGWQRLTVTADEGDFAGAIFTADHSPARQVASVIYTAPPNIDLSTQDARRRQQIFEKGLRDFVLPGPPSIARQGSATDVPQSMSEFEGISDPKDFRMTCRVEGMSALVGREVVVIFCESTTTARGSDPARGVELTADVATISWQATDIATGATRRYIESYRLKGTRTEAGRTYDIIGTGWRTRKLD
jgi:hypothetical protein